MLPKIMSYATQLYKCVEFVYFTKAQTIYNKERERCLEIKRMVLATIFLLVFLFFKVSMEDIITILFSYNMF